ncbi:MAG: hypothetical protein K940chlam9_01480 [Chlamydiae bacterium]|nr:hypothetical protein [Chlamydiota bacterium]
MELIITEWALSSYIGLLDKHVFTKETFQKIIRPDVLLLKKGAESDPKFENRKFWGPATYQGRVIHHGWKMKWHNFGNGKIQLRLAVVVVNERVFLCQGYVKRDDKVDQREMALFMNRVQKIILNKQVIIRGVL